VAHSLTTTIRSSRRPNPSSTCLIRTHGYRSLPTSSTGLEICTPIYSKTPCSVSPSIETRSLLSSLKPICKTIRGLYPRLPILVVTSRSSLEKQLATFEAGADDCMIWPLSERELSARLRSAIRRFRASAVSTCQPLVIGEIALDPIRHRATKSGSDVPLTPTEFSVLETLMRQPGIPISHSIFVFTIWAQESKANREHLRVVISSLRRKLEDDPTDPRYLITHACYGYCFRDH
jgi:two-component system, OmpR family, KDP operon response regulator KdpE